MKRQTLVILAVAAMVLAGLGLYLASQEKTDAVTDQVLLFPELDAAINDITTVAVDGPGNERLVTINKQEKWVVAEKDNYPADFDQVTSIIFGLSRVELAEAKTKNPDNYGRLGVQLLDAPGEVSGNLLSLTSAEKDFSVFVGIESRGGRYVRIKDAAQSYLTDRNIDLPPDPTQWLSKALLDIEEEQVQAVTVRHAADNESFALIKEAKNEANFSLVDQKDSEELSAPSIGNPVAGVLTRLMLEDVQAAEKVDFSDAIETEYKLFDGINILAKTVFSEEEEEGEEERWTRFSVSFDDELLALVETQLAEAMSDEANLDPLPSDEAAGEAESASAVDPLAALKDKIAALKEAKTMALTLQEKLSPWAYALPEYKFQQLTKQRSDLLKQPEA